ncbi:hypothetical protein B296_00055388 [Ensete ventricosum]|uniref:Uncharacterized protein n=1 Tax=Ensete ventricosum TaxID=4639 RepID=A0A426XZW1_ENSVE|nr:hypothetical protein B296_00055388 [Ensete ventricosum]
MITRGLLAHRQARQGGLARKALPPRFGLWRFANVSFFLVSASAGTAGRAGEKGCAAAVWTLEVCECVFLSRQRIGLLVLRFLSSSEEGCANVHLTPNGVDSMTY